MRRKPASVQALTELGRVRLSKSFFMRDMLHSEIAQVIRSSCALALPYRRYPKGHPGREKGAQADRR